MVIVTRRNLITGAAAFICAPAIVRFSSLMPIAAWDETSERDAFKRAILDGYYNFQTITFLPLPEWARTSSISGFGQASREGKPARP